MDPFSIGTGAATILNTLVKTSYQVSQFIGEVKDASKDMLAVTRELDALSAPLTQLSNNQELIASLRTDSGITDIMASCDTVLVDMSALMQRTAEGRMSSMRWAMSGKAEMGKLRIHLEAYKSALVIVLNVHNASLTGQISRDVRFIPEMYEQIQALCTRLPGESFAIQRFLEDTASYAETAFEGSVMDAVPVEAFVQGTSPSILPQSQPGRRISQPVVKAAPKPKQRKAEQPSMPSDAKQGVSQHRPSGVIARVNERSERFSQMRAEQKRKHLSSQEKSELDESLYMVCWSYKGIEPIKQHLKRGADPNSQRNKPHAGFQNFGYPLQVVVDNVQRDYRPVQLLLDWGADINRQGGYYGNALQAAIIQSPRYGDFEILRLLLDRGAKVNTVGGVHGSALHAAVITAQRSGYELKVVKLLVEYGANVNLRTPTGHTPMHCAAKYRHLDVVEYLYQSGADINAKTWDGVTPLGAAHMNRARLELNEKLSSEHYLYERESITDESENPVISFLKSKGAARSVEEMRRPR